MQIRRFRGSRTVTSLRLCSRAPWTTSSSAGITDPVYRGWIGRTSVRLVGRNPASQAAPAPVLGPHAEPRADRVVEDVFTGSGEVVVALDDPRRVPVAEQVSRPPVPLVEPECVDAVQPLHRSPKLRNRRLDDEVVMRRHQAERVNGQTEAVDALRQQLEEAQTVRLVAVDVAAVDAARRDVEDAVRQRMPQLSSHATEASAGEERSRQMWSFCHANVAKTTSASANTEGQTLVLTALNVAPRKCHHASCEEGRGVKGRACDAGPRADELRARMFPGDCRREDMTREVLDAVAERDREDVLRNESPHERHSNSRPLAV